MGQHLRHDRGRGCGAGQAGDYHVAGRHKRRGALNSVRVCLNKLGDPRVIEVMDRDRHLVAQAAPRQLAAHIPQTDKAHFHGRIPFAVWRTFRAQCGPVQPFRAWAHRGGP